MTLAQLFDLAFGNIGRFFKEIAFKKEERGKLSYGLVGTLILVLTYGLIMLFSARDRKSTRLNSSHANESRMPSSA